MIVRSFQRTSVVANPSTGTRQMSWTKACTIGMATGLANPRSALSVASVFAVAMPAQPNLGIAAAAVATMVAVSIGWYFLVAGIFTTEPIVRGYRQIGHWVDRFAGGMPHAAGRQTGNSKQVA
jgi:threonine efflux protein